MTGVRVLAPAKLNLGLAVLGKRPDGYHDIDTIMAMIDLADTITIRPTRVDGITIRGMDGIPVESNLITRAIRGWCARARVPARFDADVHKRIPSPAGLGGASSDAAATLRALNALYSDALPDHDLHQLAASLGADCPFFLGTPVARATGTGTQLTPIPLQAGWAVIVVPPSSIATKTATMYASLTPADYLRSENIDRIQHGFVAGTSPELVNSFTRPAREHFLAVNCVGETLAQVAGTWALSGAGPAMYALTRDEAEAVSWSTALTNTLPTSVAVIVSRFIDAVPEPELLA